MKEFFKSFACKVLGVIALVLVGVMIYAASTGGFATIPATLVGAIVTPLQTAVTGIADGVSGFFGQFGNSRELRDRAEALEKENNELQQKLVDYDKMKEDNQWYAKILGLHEQHSDYHYATGKVIAVDPTGKYFNFSINAGSANGIKKNDPVITPEGLIGVVEEAGLTYARVRTILDPDAKVSAAISRNGETGYTSGTASQAQKGLLRLNTLSRDSGAAMGDYVVTSGIGGIYPAGLKIGEIIDVSAETDGMTLFATVKPFADIQNTKRVTVIIQFDGQGEGVK